MAEKIAIIGSGLIGRAWSIVFARAGHEVALYDPVDGAVAKALEQIEAGLPDLADKQLLNGETPAAVLKRMGRAADLGDALADCVHVQESAPEKLAVKQALYRDLDKAAPPDAVLASSTSAIPASAFTEPLDGRARCLVAHPINPPHIVPLVELVPAPWTAADVVSRSRALMAAVGQAPITLNKEIDGFVANRMQVALVAEAFRLVAQGVCTTADIDTAIAAGIGLRWAFMGPFETIDLNAPGGVADYCARFRKMYTDVEAGQQGLGWTEDLIAQVETERRSVLPADQLVRRSQWRDNRLAELAVWKKSAVDG